MENQNQMPQQMAQPQFGQTPVQPKKEINLDKEMILKIALIAGGALIILGVFLPMLRMSAYGMKESTSIWSLSKFTSVVMIIVSLIPIGTALLGKCKQISYLPAGFALYNVLYYLANYLDLESSSREYIHISFGWFFLLLGSIAIIAVNIIENIDEIKGLFNFKITVSNNAKVAPVAAPVASVAAPVAPVQTTPAAQSQDVLCSKCGAKKVGEEKFCMSCGNQF